MLASSFLAAGVSSADEDTPLAKNMDEISGPLKEVYKELRRDGTDFAKYLEQVRESQSYLLKSFDFVPAMIEKMPDGKDKQIAMAKYKKTLAASYETLCGLELALISEDLEAIEDAIDLVKKSRKDGHNEFIEEGD